MSKYGTSTKIPCSCFCSVAHVVNEHQPVPLRLQLLQGDVQLKGCILGPKPYLPNIVDQKPERRRTARQSGGSHLLACGDAG